jgi:hypothetical protein
MIIERGCGIQHNRNKKGRLARRQGSPAAIQEVEAQARLLRGRADYAECR